MNIYNMTSRQKLLLLFKESHLLQRKIAGHPSNDRLNYAIAVFTAQSLKAYTIWSICNPLPRSEILENNGVIHDFQSGYVLLRSMYETVLVSRFILLDEEFANSRIAVVKVAQLHGLREQNWLLTKMKSTNPMLNEIRVHLTNLKTEILEHDQYNGLPSYAQEFVKMKDIPNSQWFPRKLETIKPSESPELVATMEELALRAGFHVSQHFQYNKYFSNYIHSDPFAIMQIGAVEYFGDSQQMTGNLYYHAENFLAVLLDIHIAVCKSEDISLDITDESSEIIKLWQYINSRDWTEERAKIQ